MITETSEKIAGRSSGDIAGSLPLLTRVACYFVLLLAVCATSCSNSKHLPKGETLYRGNKVNIHDDEATSKERKVLNEDLAGIVRPKTNSKFLGMRIKLALYNLAGNPKKTKGIHKVLRNIGEPPVLASSVNLDVNKALMVNLLQNKGFFFAKADAHFQTDSGKRKTSAVFDVVTRPQYHIENVYFRPDTLTGISNDIKDDFSGTLLVKGAPYNLDLVKAERSRIDGKLKEKGYFYFKPDYIIVLVDSNIGDHKVNMYVKTKHREIPEEAYHRYTINDVYIYANYKLRGKNQDTNKANAIFVDSSYHIIDSKKAFKPQVLADAMVFEKGDEYSLQDQNISLSRLVNMGTFKFVKNRFDNISDSLLDVYYYLTPYPKKSLRFQIGALTQNDNRAGTEGSISIKNRNTFKGAEALLFKISGGFEKQFGGEIKRPNIYNLGLETDLSFPRFVVPFFNIQSSSRYLPRTIIKLKYDYEAESDLLSIKSYTGSYGYDWKEGPHKEHQFFPINFTYVHTDTLGNKDSIKERYGNLVFDGIILGPTYEFTYNSQIGSPRRNSYYFDGLIDLSGNILGLLEKADYKDNPKKIFDNQYAQYVKVQPEFRYYLRLSEFTTIATRIMAGIGLPYGNSSQLPNVKQFWAGGNSDLRGFPSRLLGPGTFNALSAENTGGYLETLGDIKAEFNIELRQNIYKFLNFGLFLDAGNIWLYNDNPLYPGGKFTSDFYKELAVDAGFGLRFDFQILLLRLDLGIPIREPYLAEGDRSVIDKIAPADNHWRRDNLVFNLAIGYPF